MPDQTLRDDVIWTPSEEVPSTSSSAIDHQINGTGLTFLSTAIPAHKQWLQSSRDWWAPWNAVQEAFSRVRRRLWDSGLACMLLAAFVFAVSVLCVKLTAGRVPVLEITLIRSILSWLVSVGVARVQGMPWGSVLGSRSNWGWLTARGVTGTLSMTMYYGSLMLLPMGDAVVIFFLNPPITAVLAFLIRREPLGWMGIAGCVASLGGLLLIVHPPFLMGGHENWGPMRLLGAGFGVAASVLAAAAFISIRFIGRSEPALTVALWFHSSTLVLSALPLAIGWPNPAVNPSAGDAGLLVGVAATSFLGQLLLTRGFQLMDAGRASSINFTQVVHSYVYGVLFLHEHPTLLGALGALLVAAGVGLSNTRQQQAERDKMPLKQSADARHVAGAGVGSILSLGRPRGGYVALESTEEGAAAVETAAESAGQHQQQQQQQQLQERQQLQAKGVNGASTGAQMQPLAQELAKLGPSESSSSRRDDQGRTCSPIAQQPSRDVSVFVLEDDSI